ncbi:MAG: hypothetical protein GF390_03095 [Candidatus Pacebacteria bacterium]|nr:hypothetical protein [Candidatus Paceibacterota bacterium]
MTKKNIINTWYLFLAIVFCTLFVLFFTWPGVIKLKKGLIGAGGDTYQYMGFQGLVTHQLQEFRYPFQHIALWRYPEGFDLSRGYDSWLSNMFGGSLTLFLHDRALAYNLTILTSFIFNAFCGYLWGYQLTKSRLLGLLSSVGLGFSFYNLARGAAHASLLLTGGFFLVGYALLKLKEDIICYWSVTAGSYLVFKSDVFAKNGFFTITYDYQPSADMQPARLISVGLEKIYEDDDKEAYLIL